MEIFLVFVCVFLVRNEWKSHSEIPSITLLCTLEFLLFHMGYQGLIRVGRVEGKPLYWRYFHRWQFNAVLPFHVSLRRELSVSVHVNLPLSLLMLIEYFFFPKLMLPVI